MAVAQVERNDCAADGLDLAGGRGSEGHQVVVRPGPGAGDEWGGAVLGEGGGFDAGIGGDDGGPSGVVGVADQVDRGGGAAAKVVSPPVDQVIGIEPGDRPELLAEEVRGADPADPSSSGGGDGRMKSSER